MKIDTILITGATGYLGNALIPELLKRYAPRSLRIFGRSESKLVDLLRRYGDMDHDRLRALVGDVRDEDRIRSAVRDVDLVIHAAALKRLEVCNYSPEEAIKTNVQGSLNVLKACMEFKPAKAVFISSDKAVRPTNLYGMTKAIMEEAVLQTARFNGIGTPKLAVCRYGNVIGSTGAAIPYFIQQIRAGKPITITHKDMTRFLLTRRDAVKIVCRAIEGDDRLILPLGLRAIPLLKAVCYIGHHFGSEVPISFTHPESGEKLHEEIEVDRFSNEAPEVSEADFIAMLKEEGLL
ncbi:MAG TPA: SDR family NAD(P)-dependent oxidoreductase [Candidatus Omnitrophota bacterium]|nr:SDR family NAD(P)-dependent oxidoreductase [Candidatus Omnitrophota bacterium]